MGDCHIYQDEIRVSLRDTSKLEMWVLLRGEGDCPFQVLGWRYKAFKMPTTVFDVFQMIGEDRENPIEWERRDPLPTVLNYTPDWDILEAQILSRTLN